jgi:hypothetical protein
MPFEMGFPIHLLITIPLTICDQNFIQSVKRRMAQLYKKFKNLVKASYIKCLSPMPTH